MVQRGKFLGWLQAGCYTLLPDPAMLGVMMILLVDMGFPRLGVRFWGSFKDYSILGSRLGSPNVGKVPYCRQVCQQSVCSRVKDRVLWGPSKHPKPHCIVLGSTWGSLGQTQLEKRNASPNRPAPA